MEFRRVTLIIVFLLALSLPTIAAALPKTTGDNTNCQERLSRLEPADPKVIYDYELLSDRNLTKLNLELYPVGTVIKKGLDIRFVSVYSNPKWKRPVYHPNWHSTNVRWSYIPFNLAYQQHTLFSYQGGLSWWYDLSHHLALPEEAGNPSPIHQSAFTIKYPHVTRLILFNASVTSLKHYKNQLAVIAKPKRAGIHVIDFDHKRLPKGQKLVQLVTKAGDEIDYLILWIR